MSDVHLEFLHERTALLESLLAVEADVMLIAGDFTNQDHLTAIKEMASLRKNGKRIVQIKGNHEYYQGTGAPASASQSDRRMREVCDSNEVVLLDNRMCEIDGVRFLGTTLWYPPYPAEALLTSLNDPRMIAQFPIWRAEQNQQAVAFLKENLRAGDVLMTHHPSVLTREMCGEPQGLPLETLGTDLSDLIFERQPAYIFFGHIHFSLNLSLGQTKICSNPRGYPFQINPDFDPALVFSL